MSKAGMMVLAVAFALPGLVAVPAMADSTQASCEFRKHGEVKKKASGPCSFSQRQGYVDISLKNGRSFNLTPGEKPNHFKDQEDHKVVREADGDKQVYRWEHMRVIVTFNEG